MRVIQYIKWILIKELLVGCKVYCRTFSKEIKIFSYFRNILFYRTLGLEFFYTRIANPLFSSLKANMNNQSVYMKTRTPVCFLIYMHVCVDVCVDVYADGCVLVLFCGLIIFLTTPIRYNSYITNISRYQEKCNIFDNWKGWLFWE